MVPPSVVIKGGICRRRFARTFSWRAGAERLVNAIFIVIISEFFQLSLQVDGVPDQHVIKKLSYELFPAEQARIVQLLVTRVDVSPDGADIRLRTAGLTNLVADLRHQSRIPQGGVMTEPNPTNDGRSVTVRVPISIRRRGGRKLVLAPDGTNVTTAPIRRHIDNAMVKARPLGGLKSILSMNFQ
jgi:hypothetical protein